MKKKWRTSVRVSYKTQDEAYSRISANVPFPARCLHALSSRHGMTSTRQLGPNSTLGVLRRVDWTRGPAEH